MRSPARALTALTFLALAGLTGCADLTRPDVQVHADPTVASAPKPSASADRVAMNAPAAPVPAATLDVHPLDAVPGRIRNLLPSPTDPAPAAAAGGGGG